MSLDRSTWQKGDLVFYNVNGKIGHVGIYLGNDELLHSNLTLNAIVITHVEFCGPPVAARRIITISGTVTVSPGDPILPPNPNPPEPT